MKKIALFIFLFTLVLNIYSNDLNIQRRQSDKKIFKQFFFEIVEPLNWNYFLFNTSEKNIKSHRWIDESKNYIIDVRVAENFVHLNFPSLRAFYIENIKDFIILTEIENEKQILVSDRWVWRVLFIGKNNDNKEVKLLLFITKNRSFVYFISAIYPKEKEINYEQIKVINSIKYL